MKNTDRVWDFVDARRDDYIGLSDRVFDQPEIAYTEFRSVAEHRKMLEQEGFRITEGVAGIPTAIVGEAGDEGPVIAILGEFDALPELGQVAGVAEQQPVEQGGPGHGCGHNLLGSAALMAASSVKDYLAERGIKGRVRYYGCPAEEGGAAKTFMVREGLFDDVDAAISWHPATFTAVNEARSLANTRIDFTFHGRAAHAAGAPELGRSALDAIELMNVGINYMREHMPDDARIHYAYLDAGGIAPNVVQSRATVRQLVRAGNLKELHGLIDRVRKVAEGAALMTETTVESRVVSGVSNLIGNRPLEETMQRNMERLGAPEFDDMDRAFAEKIRATLSEDNITVSFRRVGMEVDPELALCNFVVPLERQSEGGEGSTDVGDVSWAVPTVQARVATCAVGTPFHTWQLTAQGKAPAAHKGMTHAAKIIAGTAVDLFEDSEVLQRAIETHRSKLEKEPYDCPISKNVSPPLKAMSNQ
ncbi:aminobenzoyl-glutamate utilization protein B [Labrenzia sp. EL_208]|uniref:M20 family metallopeptidase n=1 Tax=Roseibium album TaxID=311410 RepID=UPI0018C9AE3B|nr:M20 family metallopeptidase [Roseibium album]MBG6159846.1 aminobenzoyl-glutamate utilization protein B [Labrenzia sp. EL_162]MBG6176618.1 aminobenzoyl-glutamate utilization protein B [Labrenzia sp. EL_132]MBG6198378.1 aminobenzoyl-glutamate utilization protein B [Labrenzia sp. EL_159]MBG6230912.1 aminobenzoyl-glutamate utilization protein B [Labrenzia sp. EL_208]MCR9061380.1 M20 family metallopeptidase [Paracoccaceae bacterium]